MLYAVGTHIDLRHLNTKMQIVDVPEKPAKKQRQIFHDQVQSGYDAGTQLIFKLVNGQMVAARKINVAFG